MFKIWCFSIPTYLFPNNTIMNYFCNTCRGKYGISTTLPFTNLTGSTYTFEKFHKHVIDPPLKGLISKFVFRDYNTYQNMVEKAYQNGVLEIDYWKRLNLVWSTGSPIGYVYEDGIYLGMVDSVKVVLPIDGNLIHAFATSSTWCSTVTRCSCGRII